MQTDAGSALYHGFETKHCTLSQAQLGSCHSDDGEGCLTGTPLNVGCGHASFYGQSQCGRLQNTAASRRLRLQF